MERRERNVIVLLLTKLCQIDYAIDVAVTSSWPCDIVVMLNGVGSRYLVMCSLRC